MSRDINLDHPESLSDEDIAYLRARGRVNVIQMLDAAAQAKPVEVEEVEEPYDKWTVEELREELKNRELSQDGNKKDLVARLEENDAATGE